MKRSIKLNYCDIQFKPRSTIKGQAAADFIAEFTYKPVEYPTWELHVDGDANEKGAGVGLAGLGQENHNVKFAFQASNNEAKYEGIIHGLKVPKDLEIKNLKVYSEF